MLVEMGITFLALSFVLAAIAVAIVVCENIKHKYEEFILHHSVALKRLLSLNQQYVFSPVFNLNLQHSYDNEHFYDAISPTDYLIYYLVDGKDLVLKAISDAAENQVRYTQYCNAVEQIREFNRYDAEHVPKSAKMLARIEARLYKETCLSPSVSFSVGVTLTLVKINGVYRSSKGEIFFAEELYSLIDRINQKNGNRYIDYQIWQAICRVERGRVSNRLRFLIYERDGYRCKMCGRGSELEIDHIIPVSKGGKSEYQNLQTLCCRCNTAKSNKTDSFVKGNYESTYICPWCGDVLVLRNGQYGRFWGCSSYPKCKFTKRLR